MSEASDTAAVPLGPDAAPVGGAIPPVGAGGSTRSAARRPLALRPVPAPDGIPAKRCPVGHPNDVEAGECRVCGHPLDAAAAVIELPPESLGRLLLEDGSATELVADLTVGRSPAAPGIGEALAVAGRQVSRTHLLIEVRGWRLQIRDLGSTNGTFLTRRGERGRRRVPEERPVPLRVGDTVHFGSRQALVAPRGR